SVTALLMKWSEHRRSSVAGAQEILVTGEVLDMTCYIASNLSGPDHAECARVCIRSGEPAGIKTQDGKVYLLTGEPGQSINAKLADYAAKTVTIKGRQTVRDGFAHLQVEEIRKMSSRPAAAPDGTAMRACDAWDSTRLQENSRRPQPDEMRSIFARLGLGGD